MSYEHKIGNGSLFKNTNKTNDNQPDYSGSIKLQDGKDQQIAAWIKEGVKGKFFSLKLSDPYVKPESNSVETSQNSDDLPF
jgi:uncharacterized protein (DUF736 family)|tara:strand:- start:242 stop:484 length:243 start_codon:yes stop_codon:yes gene_type:complete